MKELKGIKIFPMSAEEEERLKSIYPIISDNDTRVLVNNHLLDRSIILVKNPFKKAIKYFKNGFEPDEEENEEHTEYKVLRYEKHGLVDITKIFKDLKSKIDTTHRYNKDNNTISYLGNTKNNIIHSILSRTKKLNILHFDTKDETSEKIHTKNL